MSLSLTAASVDGSAALDEAIPPSAEIDRRLHARRPLGELPWIEKVRLKYGPTLSVVDLSAGGAQFELEDAWLRPDSIVVVEIVGRPAVLAVPSRVVRCQVAGIAPSIRYRGALEFRRLLEFPDPDRRATPGHHHPNPLHSHARLTLALRRFDGALPGDIRIVDPQAAGDSSSPLGAGAMDAALAMLDTPAGRRAGGAFARELSALFGELAQGIELREPSQELTARLERRLRRVIPARSIRVRDSVSAERARPGSEIVYFDAPSGNGLSARKILVEFAAGAAPQEWQFQLLKASGHLVALISAVDERPRSSSEDAGSIREADDAQAGWNKLVVRFADGRLLKGYCQDFLPTRGHFQLCSSPIADSSVLVPLSHLKAVCFVRDFEGNADCQDDRTTEYRNRGRKVAVTFLDDELLVGTTLNYGADGAGFFITPCTPHSNNLRIFVSNRAVRHVSFL